MNKWVQAFMVMVLLGALLAIRFFEEALFYDPLLLFFKTDHTTAGLPEFQLWKLLVHTAWRYFLNTIVSLAILWVVFRSRSVLKFSSLLYFILFIVLLVTYVVLLESSQEGAHLALFYVRRFLIQPLFLVLLLPAFYAQRIAYKH